jgi:hypothetical protein
MNAGRERNAQRPLSRAGLPGLAERARWSLHIPVPRQIRCRIAIHGRIVRHGRQRIRGEREAGVCWPRESIVAFQVMKALALPLELHPAWQDIWFWYP